MEIRKSTLTTEALFREVSAQVQMESAIPLPQGKTLDRVLSYESEATVREVSCRDGAVVVTGTMTVKPFVESAERIPYAFEASAAFSHTIRLDGATPEMNARVRAEIPACTLKNEDGGLRMQATVSLTATVIESRQIPCITDLDGARGLERQTAAITLRRRTLLGAKSTHISEPIPAPRGSSVLKAGAVPLVTGLMRDSDGMRVEGELRVSTLYLAQDGGVLREDRTLPFADLIPCESGENASASVTLTQLSVVIEEEGAATVDASLSIGVYGCVSDTQRILLDAYDDSGSFLCSTKDASALNYEAVWSQTVQMNEALAVPAHMKDAYLPICVSMRTAITGVGTEENRGRIEGVLAATVVYRDDNGMKQSFTQELPLSFETEAKGDVLIPRIRVLETSLSGGGRTVGLTFTMAVEAEWYRQISFRYVPELLPAPAREPDSGMLVWFADPDESLFSVGKRFSIPIERVRACNPDLTEPIKVGTPVLIFRNKN